MNDNQGIPNDDASSVREFCRKRGIREVGIGTVDRLKSILVSWDGCSFREIASGLWASCDDRASDGVVYMGSVSHGGGIVLKPLYVDMAGTWRSYITGKASDASRFITEDMKGNWDGNHGKRETVDARNGR